MGTTLWIYPELSAYEKGKNLYTVERVADYVLSKIPENRLIPVDFCQPEDVLREDSTAAAILACGLIELSRVADEVKKTDYYNMALQLLRTLCEKRCCFSPEVDYLLEKCTAAYHDKEHEFTIIYGDYFLIEALFKLSGEELFIW